jgi:hypothetical protein
MTPTNKLRFVKRFETIMLTEHTGEHRPVKILQQWWADYDAFGAQITGEWRDVKVEE